MEYTKKILLASDFSANSDHALQTAFHWSKQLNAKLSVLNIADLSPGFSISPLGPIDFPQYQEVLLEGLTKQLDKQIQSCCSNGGKDIEREIIFGPIIETLLEKLENNNIELLIVGSKGHSNFEHLYMGSLTEKMIQLSPVPVLAVKKMAAIERPQNIMLPLDLNHDTRELYWGRKLAKLFSADLQLIHVVSPEISDNPQIQKEIENGNVQCIEDILEIGKKIGEEKLEILADELKKENINCTWTVLKTSSLSPAKALLRELQKNSADLLLMGTNSRTGLNKWIMGSVAESLIRKSPISALVMRNLE